MRAFDTETTGIDPHNDRIVTAAMVYVEPGQRPKTLQWLIHPETDIPAEASDVHGWTIDRIEAKLAGHAAMTIDARGRERFLQRETAIFEIATQVAASMLQEVPLVVHNASFDLTLLEAEALRNDVPTLASRPKGVTGVVDTMVLEKQYDPFRKQCYKAAGCNPDERHHECGGCRGGKYQCGGCGSTDRTMTSLCNHYGLVLGAAHDAGADALAAARLAWKLGNLAGDLGRLRLSTLHQKQVEWRRDQQLSLKKFFTRVGKPVDDICPEWPLHAACARLAVSA
jgi:DNA polymerase-3 subunit epsilon